MREHLQIRRLTAAFNLADPDQKRLYEHANRRRNVSAYIKRLIQRDMEGVLVTRAVPQNAPEPPVELDQGLMRGLL